jgi:hypothetical protein
VRTGPSAPRVIRRRDSLIGQFSILRIFLTRAGIIAIDRLESDIGEVRRRIIPRLSEASRAQEPVRQAPGHCIALDWRMDRMIRRSCVFFSLFVLTLGAYAAPKLLEHVPLQWKPTSELSLGGAQISQAPIQFETFKDTRQKPELIGENREDAAPKPVTTTDDVGAFVSTHMRDLFKRAGLDVVDSNGAVIVKGEVQRFFVGETGTYQGEVAVHLTLTSPDGTKLWSGTASGDAKRFGRSYKLENYYEVLSDSLVNTTSSILRSDEFQKAMSQH